MADDNSMPPAPADPSLDQDMGNSPPAPLPPLVIQPDPALDSAPAPIIEPVVPVESAPANLDEVLVAPPPIDELNIPNKPADHGAFSQEFSKDNFSQFSAGQILAFVNLMDLEDAGARRNQIINFKMSEGGLESRIDLAESFFKIQAAYASYIQSAELLAEAAMFKSKIDSMKQWLSL